MKKTYQERMKNLEVTVSELREYKIEKREIEVREREGERWRNRLNKIEKERGTRPKISQPCGVP